MTQTSTTHTFADLTALANRMTYHRAKAEAMGFEFRHIGIDKSPWDGGKTVVLRCVFVCLCGRIEEFSKAVPASLNACLLPEWTNVARQLWEIGSFSRSHLIADGYTEEQVDEIEAKGKAFDDECRVALLWSAA